MARISIVPFILYILVVGCGKAPAKSKLNKIFDNGYMWQKIPEDRQSRNIFKIVLNKDVIGSGFILSESFITNAHIIKFYKLYCGLNECSDLTAINAFGQLKIKESIVLDKALDFSVVNFEWVKEPEQVKSIEIARYYPSVGELVQLNGYSKTEKSFVTSKGSVTSTNYSIKRKPRFCYPTATEKGHSGSPVFDTEKRLIGIHYGDNVVSNCAIPIKMIVEKYPELF